MLQFLTYLLLFHFESLVLVRFQQATFSVTEDVNSSVAITLEAVGDHLETAFNVTVVTVDSSATRGCIPYIYKFTGDEVMHAPCTRDFIFMKL